MMLAVIQQNTFAFSSYRSRIPNGSAYSCLTCHGPSGPPLKSFGTDFKNAGLAWTAALAAKDSDGDGFSNGRELGDPNGIWTQGQPNPSGEITNPGDSTSHPALVTPPSITSQPTNQIATVGATVTFLVSASGTEPFEYQWQKDSLPLPGATNLSLVLTNLTLADGGVYRVMVSNPANSVTSSNATLTVLDPKLKILVVRTNANAITLAWPASPGGFTLQHNVSLATTNWTSVTNPATQINDQIQVVIPTPTGTDFYRLMHP